MPTTSPLLSQIRAQKEKRFENVSDLRIFVEMQHPKKFDQVSVDMVVYHAEVFHFNRHRGVHISLISKEAADHFSDIQQELQSLDDITRDPFLFNLTIWDAESVDKLKPGTQLSLSGVYNLSIWNNRLLQGCVSIDQCANLVK